MFAEVVVAADGEKAGLGDHGESAPVEVVDCLDRDEGAVLEAIAGDGPDLVEHR